MLVILNISLAFIAQLQFAVPKKIGLNSTYHFIMKVPSQQELQQIAHNHSSDAEIINFMSLYAAKRYSVIANVAILESDNALCIGQNIFKRIWKRVMTNDDKIRDEKLQYNINRETASISPLSTGKIDKLNTLQLKKILPTGQSGMIKHAKLTYYPLRKAFANKQGDWGSRKKINRYLKTFKPLCFFLTKWKSQQWY